MSELKGPLIGSEGHAIVSFNENVIRVQEPPSMLDEESTDQQYHDAHYLGDVQPIELMQAQFTPEEFRGALKANIIRYVSRLGKKDDPKKESDKILRYAEWLRQFVHTGKIELEKVQK